jgi:hypothetical protein
VKSINGLWQTKSGSVYEFFQTGSNVSAIYSRPSKEQLECGIKSGDIAYVGDLLGAIICGQFHHRAQLGDQKQCPANWYFVTVMYLTISADSVTMEGDLLIHHIADTCQLDDRRIDHLIFTRV